MRQTPIDLNQILITMQLKTTLPFLCLLFLTRCHTGKTERKIPDHPETAKISVNGFLPLYADTILPVHLEVWDARNLLEPAKTWRVEAKGGYFGAEIELSGPQLVTLTIDDRPLLRHFGGYGLLIEPNDSLFIQIPQLENAQLTGVHISGSGMEKQNLMKELTVRLSDLEYPVHPLRQTIAQRVEVALLRKKLVDQTINSYRGKVAETPLAITRQYMIASLYNDVARFLLKEDLSDPEMISLYQDRFKPGLPLTLDLTPELIVAPDKHRKALQDAALLDYLIENKEAGSNEWRSDKRQFFNVLGEVYAGSPLRDWVLSASLVNQAKWQGWDDDLESVAADFYLGAPDSVYYGQVKTIRSRLKTNLSKGAPAPGFTLPGVNGELISLEDFRGKVVLIDFMFTGCAGCKQLVPALEALERWFSKKKVAFVSISVDRTKERFLKGLGKFSSPGAVHLYTEGQGSEHPTIRAYGIQAYPTLTLIDREGNILSARAPDPRTEEGMRELVRLVEEGVGR